MIQQTPPGASQGPESVPLRVLRVSPAQPLYAVFLYGLRGLYIHYKKSGSALCWRGQGECALCAKSAAQYRAYAPIVAWDQPAQLWHPWVVELTGTVEEKLRGRSLRGEQWMLWRQSTGRKQITFGCKYLDRWPEEETPQAFGIEGCLQRLYHVADLPKWSDNGVSPIVYVQKTEAKPPTIPQELMPQPIPEDRPTEDQMRRIRQMMGNVGKLTGPRVREEMLRSNGHTSDNGGAQ
jgi:hypothetical protein